MENLAVIENIQAKNISHKLESESSVLKRKNNSKHIISGLYAKLIRAKFRIHVLGLAIKTYGFSVKSFNLFKELKAKRKLLHGNSPIVKWIHANGKYFWYLYAPGFKSQQLDDVLLEEMNRMIPSSIKPRALRFAHFAITKKCTMKCEHCFEWDNINKKEILSFDDLRCIVLKLKDAGVSQIHLSGGEPMLRVDDIVKLSEEFSSSIDFWILTSGFNFTYDNAKKLKQAGITGVMVSLDHYDEKLHNEFRRFDNAFKLAVDAIKFSRYLDMVTGITVCTTKSFLQNDNLMKYADFAKSLDVSYIQILEPKAVGHYEDKDVLLNNEQLEMLTTFYQKINFDKKFSDYPIVVYHGNYQRKFGCFNSGNRALYIDTNGEALACTFCHTSSGNALYDDLNDVIKNMRAKGCSDYGLAVV